jgi:hypothetical protein
VALTQPDGPHVRLGIVWAAITLAALLLGPDWLAGWLALVAALAASSAARSWGAPTATSSRVATAAHRRTSRGRDSAARTQARRVLVQPPVPITAVLAAVVTLSSIAGWGAVGLAAAGVTFALVAGAVFGPLGRPDALRRVLIVLLPSLAGASLVLARAHGLADAMVLAGMATVYDSSAYLIGTGAPNRWEGLIAGVASIAALTLFVAAVLVPPFSGSSPWVLGLAAAVLAPIGPAIGRHLVAEPSARVPAFRRLDSLFLLGPVWAAAAVGLLHH